ncbi:hypothetical protein Droror1_Dr00023712 [Drosera rotundifolia]
MNRFNGFIKAVSLCPVRSAHTGIGLCSCLFVYGELLVWLIVELLMVSFCGKPERDPKLTVGDLVEVRLKLRGVKLFLFGFARSERRVTDWVILCVLLRLAVCGFEVVLELSALELIALMLEEPSDDSV